MVYGASPYQSSQPRTQPVLLGLLDELLPFADSLSTSLVVTCSAPLSLLASFSFSAPLWASLTPVWPCEADSLAAPQAYGPMTLPWLVSPLTPPLPISPRAPSILQLRLGPSSSWFSRGLLGLWLRFSPPSLRFYQAPPSLKFLSAF